MPARSIVLTSVLNALYGYGVYLWFWQQSHWAENAVRFWTHIMGILAIIFLLMQDSQRRRSQPKATQYLNHALDVLGATVFAAHGYYWFATCFILSLLATAILYEDPACNLK